jgi:hypothetical protein
MMIKELTASVFIVRQDDGGAWQTALIWHPRLECWLPAGGHVESGETTAQAAVREAVEETGLAVTLVPGPAIPFPAGFPHQFIPAPWWTGELHAAPDSHPGTPCPRRSRLRRCHGTPRPGPTGTQGSLVHGRGPRKGRGHLPRFPALSASGKSAVASAIRARHAARDLAIVSQDTLRRDVLREHDILGGANINLVKLTTRHAANCGFNVIVEGILRTDHYGTMLTELISGHPGPAFAYYLDIPFEETMLRHASKPQAAEYGGAEMRRWYRERDLLPGGIEHVITAESSLQDTVTTIMTDTGLGTASQNPAVSHKENR